jgi:hypothetical protein
MRRRAFITLVGGATVARALTAHAAGVTVPTVGFVTPFRQGLKEAGFVEEENVNVEYRSAENEYERLPLLIDELIQPSGGDIRQRQHEGGLSGEGRHHRNTRSFSRRVLIR